MKKTNLVIVGNNVRNSRVPSTFNSTRLNGNNRPTSQPAQVVRGNNVRAVR